ncbi:amino acid adenylation domain-containing protein, partial [Bacillus wiedmannii]
MLKNNADVKFQKDGNFRGKAIETFLFDEYVYQSIVNFCDKNNVKLLQFFSALWAFQTGKSMGNDIVTIGNFDIENSFNYKSYEINMEQTIIDLINSKKDKSSTKLTELNFGNFGYNDFSGVVLYQLEKNRNSVNKGDFQLEIGLQQTEGKLKIVYNFDTDSISSMMLKLLHNRIEMICKQVMSRQAILLKDIEILHELEKQQVLIKYNETYSEYPNNKTIIELFEEQVNKTPNAIAIEFAGQELTYQQFNARTNYLGKLLREKGVGPDKIVAIITDRSIEMILGIFAVLKAGGAYLPIDPSQPIDRINYILEDSGTDILLSGHGADNVVNNIINNVAIIDLTGCKEEIATNLEHISKQNHLAYVIYTSGTTGNPKGVMVENRNLMNLIYWMLKDDFKETEVIMQKTTYAFDLSIWEMFLWCIRGAKLFLLPKEDERDFQKIAEKIKKHNVTRLSFVPSVLEEFLFYTDVNKLTSLKRIQLSGEALPIELANKYNENYSVGANLVNSYGPTETTVFATSHMVPINEKQKGIHIGKPIANTQIYIMNNEHLCGVGMVGEIYIGGEGVTRGYLNKPQLTAEKFVENPFKPGDTVYRTGDLGRWLESGDIEYLGRIDDQVKVRGYRIELGEIKTKIREIEGIQNAAVVLKELDGEKYLCGYIVADRKMNVKKVKVQLEKKLPEYMIPTYIIQMESLPVTRNGKLDKNVLPNPKHISYEKYVAPRDETERYISGIFQEILRVNRVGIDDSFFELGGHSLRAIRLVNMLEQ